MEGITALVKETVFGLCLLLLIPSLAAAMRLRRRRPALGLLLLIFSAFLFAAAARNLLSLPAFDFVDRCRPPGTGMCLDGRSFEEARRDILGEQFLTVFVFLLLPLGLGAGGVYRFLQKRNP
ncbi:MAG: hypothetical protein C4557_03445 [Anaerolineaceae bacterium]|jgi:hypothetical protein|nr:MAG: hypothetical protein C4557_03445 [Anaerolineaceae bacterium]